jgi:hypothetical protein
MILSTHVPKTDITLKNIEAVLSLVHFIDSQKYKSKNQSLISPSSSSSSTPLI